MTSVNCSHLRDRDESVSVVASLFHLGDPLREAGRQEGHERHDGGLRHELCEQASNQL